MTYLAWSSLIFLSFFLSFTNTGVNIFLLFHHCRCYSCQLPLASVICIQYTYWIFNAKGNNWRKKNHSIFNFLSVLLMMSKLCKDKITGQQDEIELIKWRNKDLQIKEKSWISGWKPKKKAENHLHHCKLVFILCCFATLVFSFALSRSRSRIGLRQERFYSIVTTFMVFKSKVIDEHA